MCIIFFFVLAKCATHQTCSNFTNDYISFSKCFHIGRQKVESLSHIEIYQNNTWLNKNSITITLSLSEEMLFLALILPHPIHRVPCTICIPNTTPINFGYGSMHRLSITFISMKFQYIQHSKSDLLFMFTGVSIVISSLFFWLAINISKEGMIWIECMFQTKIYYRNIFNERTKLRMRWAYHEWYNVQHSSSNKIERKCTRIIFNHNHKRNKPA